MLLTGFLGAGKTTLLNFMLRHPEMAGTAVVINEYGEVGLDHHLVERAEPDEIELIEGGCMCCTASGRLAEALMNLFTKSQRKQIPTIRRVIIETTGVAEPGPILQQLNRAPRLRERFVLDGVVTLVDAANAATTLDDIDLAQKQITAADRLLVTKADLVSEVLLTALKARLATMNPDAEIAVVQKGAARPAQLFSGSQRRPSSGQFRIGSWLSSADKIQLSPVLADSLLLDANSDTPQPGPYDLQTFSVIVDEPLPAWRFFGWLDFLRSLCGSDLLRVKGIINMEGEDLPRVVHGVQNSFHPVETLTSWPDTDRRSRLVFITRGWGEGTVRATLSYLLASTPEGPAAEEIDAESSSL